MTFHLWEKVLFLTTNVLQMMEKVEPTLKDEDVVDSELTYPDM